MIPLILILAGLVLFVVWDSDQSKES